MTSVRKKKTCLSLYVTLVSMLVIALISISSIKLAYGTGGGGGSESGYCSVCGSVGNRSSCVCDKNGMNWVYYAFTDYGKENAFTFPGRPNTGAVENGHVVGTVANCGTSGFWHMGYDIYQGNEQYSDGGLGGWRDYGVYTSLIKTKWQYLAKGKRGQIGTRTKAYFDRNSDAKETTHDNSDLGFMLGVNSHEVAEAKKYGTMSSVKSMFEKSIDADPYSIEKLDNYGNHYNPKQYYKKSDFDNVAWFCYDDEQRATFTGSSQAYVNGTAANNNASVVIHNSSAKVKFSHTVTRTNEGTDKAQKGSFYVNSYGDNNPSGWDYGSTSDWKKTNNELAKGKSETYTTPEKSFDLAKPGDVITIASDRVSSTLHYYAKREGDSFSDEKTSKAIVELKRPYAYFTGGVMTNVWDGTKKTGKQLVTNDNNNIGNRTKDNLIITNSDGKYYVEFQQYVKRKDTDSNGSAGGTVSVPWNTSASGGAVASDKGTKHSGSKGLTDGAQANTDKMYTASGTLRYGEEKEICADIYVDTRVVPLVVSGKTQRHSYKTCVKVKRLNKQCAISSKYTFGVNDGEDVGRIGVLNTTKAGNETIQWAGIDKLSTVTTWAKPGDNIRFAYQACAGAFYTVEENKLNDKGMELGNHFTVDGWMKKVTGNTEKMHWYKNDDDKAKADGYLFGNSVTLTPYLNPAMVTQNGETKGRWSTGLKGNNKPTSGFLSNSNNVELNLRSPSTGVTKYGCNNASGTVSKASYYQVSGKESGCVLGQIDVGGTITQTLYYTHFKIYSVNPYVSNKTKNEDNYGQYKSRAHVKVPYNYTLKPFVQNSNGSSDSHVVYVGETSNMDVGVATMKRSNDTVSSSAYATITKETYVTIKSYYIHNGAKTIVGSVSKTTKRFNTNSNLSGDSEKQTVSVKIVDDGKLAVGDKFCTEISVWPADSHDNPAIVVHGADGENNTTYKDAALREDSIKGSANSRTTASCSTVAKKPYISVESSNAFSSQGYNLPRYTKVFSGQTSTSYYFGSWSEYGVFGKYSNLSSVMASGASLGYSNKLSYGSTRTENRTRANVAANNATGSNSNACTFMTQTFANTSCTVNNAVIGNTSAKQFREKIVSRYSGSGKEPSYNKSFGSTDYKSFNSGNLSDYATSSSGNGAIAYKLTKNTYLDANSIVNDSKLSAATSQSNRTIVYDASGKNVIIGDDIKLNEDNKSNLKDVAAAIIIANEVSITTKPERIDAIIIANKVNTCAYDEAGNAINMSKLSSNVCNKTLRFNAPVVTSKLILNRTAGAGTGTSSVIRAEIFNMSSANYLWTYAQMTHFSQATTTYSRELPPRY